IYDRENVPGRIPIVAVASGTVLRAGRTSNLGYRIEIRGERGTVFTYAHLHEISDSVRAGETVVAGEILGSMGNTGFAGIQHARHQVPAHLRLTIAPQTRLTLDTFYINPYPFLRLLEEFRIDLRPQWFDPAMPHFLPQPAPQAVWPPHPVPPPPRF
ncbi:MAG: M23 family metallopeptidase, partial [Defluviitaleaceae bacterium]|nr:M23 family metallopeptidase [Defluviitaleaceae bacterium]